MIWIMDHGSSPASGVKLVSECECGVGWAAKFWQKSDQNKANDKRPLSFIYLEVLRNRLQSLITKGLELTSDTRNPMRSYDARQKSLRGAAYVGEVILAACIRLHTPASTWAFWRLLGPLSAPQQTSANIFEYMPSASYLPLCSGLSGSNRNQRRFYARDGLEDRGCGSSDE